MLSGLDISHEFDIVFLPSISFAETRCDAELSGFDFGAPHFCIPYGSGVWVDVMRGDSSPLTSFSYSELSDLVVF